MSDNIVQSNNDSTNSQPRKSSSTKKIIGYVLLVVAVLAVALTFFVNSATKAPAAESQKFLHAIQSEDATTAYSFFSVDAKKAVPMDQFGPIVSQIGPILNTREKMISKKVGGATGSAATAEVVYEINGKDAKTYRFTVNLTKEGSVWKVLNFTSKAK